MPRNRKPALFLEIRLQHQLILMDGSNWIVAVTGAAIPHIITGCALTRPASSIYLLASHRLVNISNVRMIPNLPF